MDCRAPHRPLHHCACLSVRMMEIVWLDVGLKSIRRIKVLQAQGAIKIEVTIFQLEKIFGKSKDAKAFIQELTKGQKGTPHPQALAFFALS